MVVDLGCFKELYIEYKPMFAPISQKIKFSFSWKLSIHSSVSGSLEKYVSTLQLVNWLGTKNFISLSKILIDLYDLSWIKSFNQMRMLLFIIILKVLSKKKGY